MASTLVVYSNPNMDGHCGHILREVESQLKEKNVEYTLINLETDDFDAIMHKHELTPPYTVAPLTKQYQDAVTAADKLIFVYPIWWNTMPARMKGFFDKVFAARFAFRYEMMVKVGPLSFKAPFAYPVGLLTGKKAIVYCTTGSLKWQSWIALGNRFAKIVKNDILGFCAVKARVYQLDGCTKWDDAKMPKIAVYVKNGLRGFI
jgi:NAD(P)H dehydrogenase (quinone)